MTGMLLVDAHVLYGSCNGMICLLHTTEDVISASRLCLFFRTTGMYFERLTAQER